MFSYDLREAIRNSGKSAWQIGTEVKTNPQTIRRFLRAEVGLSQEVADRICHLLDLTLVRRGEAPAQSPPPKWEYLLEHRARELAVEILRQGFDSCLRDRIRSWGMGYDERSESEIERRGKKTGRENKTGDPTL